MSEEADLLRAIVERPEEAAQTWLVLADWLDDHDRVGQAELIRLRHQPGFRPVGGGRRFERIVALLMAGVRPCVPSLVNEVGMRLVWIPRGSFQAGSPRTEPSRDGDETRHEVTLTRGFWLGESPVTQAQWRAVVGTNPSAHTGDELPVESVSRDESVAFCERLSALDGQPHRLPTEWEWEYACRAGTTTRFYWGTELHTAFANYDGTSTDGGQPTGVKVGTTTPVRAYPPNEWGLFDMHGNVFEWCAGTFASFTHDPLTDPPPPTDGSNYPARGGSYQDGPRRCRSAYRSNHVGGLAYYGFRVCVSG